MMPAWAGGVYRAAESLLKRVNRLFGEPRAQNEEREKDLREKLADYKDRLDDAWDLLREATEKTRDANRLSTANQKNMTILEVRVRSPLITVLGMGSRLNSSRIVKFTKVKTMTLGGHLRNKQRESVYVSVCVCLSVHLAVSVRIWRVYNDGMEEALP